MKHQIINLSTGTETFVDFTEEEIQANNNAKAENATLQQQLEQDKINKENKKASGKQKLLDLGLNDDEIKALIGV
jgi:regulator of replication initiation timing